MVSTVLASVLESYLGQYLELSDTRISVGSEIRLSNVQLKEAAFSELGLPLKCVHGKVRRLVIKIPWFSLFTSKTTLEVDGVHLLLVPSASVKYDELKEEQVRQENKQKRLQQAEDARRLAEATSNESSKRNEDKDSTSDKGGNDSFTERLVANIIRNLEVHIASVHLRYEDKHTKGRKQAFAAGLTLNAVHLTTTEDAKSGNSNGLKFFGKHVILDSLAFYWRPRANLFASHDDVFSSSSIDRLFDENIGTSEKPVKGLKYLLGPIRSEATLKWCPNPSLYSFSMPEISLTIAMKRLNISLTRHQYHDFIVLLEALEYMNRGSRYRKYKARYQLEGLNSYNGRLRDLWKFAFDSVYEEEVMRNINNWSWRHMKEHIAICKGYRQLYKENLSRTNPSEELKNELRRYEDALDEINIRIQRQLAEREVDQLAKERRREEEERRKSNQGGFWSWFSSSSNKAEAEDSESHAKHATRIEKDMRRLEAALSAEEKAKLFEVIDFQENAYHSTYPKSFVARILTFKLDQMVITVRDDDLPDDVANVLVVLFETVESSLHQRPSAEYFGLQLEMTKLTVNGKKQVKKRSPILVKSLSASIDNRLLKLKIEHNPPDDPEGDLDDDKGSLYDQRLVFVSSPLEIVYNHSTVLHLIRLFTAAEEVDLTTLQQSAVSKLKEYKESTVLGLQWAIENHNLIDIDVHLYSSYLVLPMKGELNENYSCPCLAVDLGNVHLTRSPMAETTPSLTDLESKLANLASTLKTSLREQAYDKFSLTLDSVQALVSIEDEDWRQELRKPNSKTSLLNPVSISLQLDQCLIRNDPEMPLTKVQGHLDEISVSIADYRLLKLAQIVDSLFDANFIEVPSVKKSESDSSMGSAISSLAGASTNVLTPTLPTALAIVPEKKRSDLEDQKDLSSNAESQLTHFIVDFSVGKVNFNLYEWSDRSNDDEKIFFFSLLNMDAHAVGRSHDMSGNFEVMSVICDHLKFTTPDNEESVRILNTLNTKDDKTSFVSVMYNEIDRTSKSVLVKNGNVVRKLDVHMARVNLCVHRDVVLDLVNKVLILVQKLSEKTKNVSVATNANNPNDEEHNNEKTCEQPLSSSSSDGKRESKRRFSRQISMKTAADVSRWAHRGKRRASASSTAAPVIDFLLEAKLEEVNIDFMTSRINFINLAVKDLSVSVKQSEQKQVIRTRLLDFVIRDTSTPNPVYPLVLRSVDDRVLDATVKLYNVTPDQKADNEKVVDVGVLARVGRVKVVFLMKTVQDLLAFLEPFSSAKDMVAERASIALEGAAQSVIEAYANATRAKLDIKLDAPLVTIPVSSQSSIALLADLGKLSLVNKFEFRDGGKRVMDQMFIDLKDLKLARDPYAKDSDGTKKETKEVNIVEPISFELSVVRNMSGSMLATDPAEMEISGTLFEVDVDLSRGDYNVIMSVLQTNFLEVGVFTLDEQERTKSAQTQETQIPNTLQLPDVMSGEDTNLKRTPSRLSIGSQRNIRETLKVAERDPLTRAVDFKLRFKGFKAELFSNDSDGEKADKHEHSSALARLAVKYIGVDGSLLINSRIEAKAYLENVVVDDNRPHEDSERRVTRLMEAKGTSESSRMVEVHYKKEPETEEQSADITVYSFILVGSIAYLLEIANFFVPDSTIVEDNNKALVRQVSQMTNTPRATTTTTTTVSAASAPQRMSVTVRVEEPDIFLVENISDLDTYALMLNTQLQFRFVTVSDPSSTSPSPFSLMASLSDIRCHTCRYNPLHRESTLAQILLPCTLSLTAALTESHGMRVNVNVSDLVLNVSVHSIEIIQNSVMAFLESFTSDNDPTEKSRKKQKHNDHSDIWRSKRVSENDFWFLRRNNEPVEGVDVLKGIDEPDRLICDEQAIVNVNNVVIKVESGKGANTIPLVLIESSVSCDIKNWTQNMTAIGTVTLLMAYYNSKLAMWEPVIEPLTLEKSDGSLITKRWSMSVTVQRNDVPTALNYVASPLESEASEVSLAAMDEDCTDGFVLADHAPPLMSISLQSSELMEVTITKSFLSTLQSLQESFAQVYDATKKQDRSEIIATAPIIIHNCTGERVVVFMECKTFVYYLMNELPRTRKSVELQHNEKLSLNICTNRLVSTNPNEGVKPSPMPSPSLISPLQEQSEQAEATLRVRVGSERQSCELLISKADCRFFAFEFRGDEMGDNQGMVSEVRIQDGSKIITLGSIVNIKNHFDVPIIIFVRKDGEDGSNGDDGSNRKKSRSNFEALTTLAPDQSFAVPINKVYCSPYQFYFQLEGDGQNIGLECFKWRRLISQAIHVETVHCPNHNSRPSTILNVVGTREEVFFERTTQLSQVRYLIDIRPRLVLNNCLPINLKIGYDHNDRILASGIGDYDMAKVSSGQSINLRHVEPEVTTIVIHIDDYLGKNYACRVRLAQDEQDLLVWRFDSVENNSNTGDKGNGLNRLIVHVQSVFSFGTRVLSLFAPFWIINKSGKELSYRSQLSVNQVYKHPVSCSDVPWLFAFSETSGRGKKKASLKIEDSQWSDTFSLDTIEDAGKITCKATNASGGSSGKSITLGVGINISMSSSSLTKVITITPFYMLSNSADYTICVRDLTSNDVVTVEPDSCAPFWPSSDSTKLVVYVKETSEISAPFGFDEQHSTLMMLSNKYGAINVSVRKSNAETLINFTPYAKGLAPVHIINATDHEIIEVKEKGAEGNIIVEPKEHCLYTWTSPAGQRTIVWSIRGFKDEFSNKLQSDGEGVIELDAVSKKYLAWVSFLDGMQRTLLFTNDANLCMSLAHSTGKNERIDTEIDFSITGIGLSLVNNSSDWKCEVLYMSVTSSEIVWEIKRRGKSRYKSLTQAQCEALEADFLLHSREKSIGKRVNEQRVIRNNNPNSNNTKDMVVNYNTSRMLEPHKAQLRRQHQKGLWIQLRMSQHQQQIHAKIYRIQIDNQMSHCLFPVIMAPVPAPRSVVADSIPKPFIEFSLLEYKSPERTDIRQFKYIHVLVQELHIKIDQGLLTALIELMEEEEILDEDIEEMLKLDLERIVRPLKDIATLHVTKGEKHFFDYLHLSPLKVHVSFSLTSYKALANNTTTRRSNFVSLFFQSLGVTVTDMHDVIFRLAYFERAHSFFLPVDLISEMIRHYTSQAIKQAYVIIFGLDVIGNPFGLVVGVGRSVEDLFYEPFQGAVEGPQEFAEGLAIGVRSVFSGVVGGAAGTMSRITGALGKGIASLTFDEDYQNKRREAIKKRGRQTVGESLARGSRGLVMGIVDGVTGVATKPIEGATKEGFSGFLRGVGKGVVGFVARPTGGIVDFASGTFDTVRRVADVTENISRVRPARFIAEDGVVRNYNLKEATGSRIVAEIDKGRLENDDQYVMHEMIDTDRGLSNKAVFVVTTRRVVFASYSQVLGNWTTEWEFELNNVVGPPPTGMNEERGTAYIIIKPNEDGRPGSGRRRMGIFSSGEAGKKVYVRNRDIARRLARAIEQQRTQLQN